MVFVCSVLIVNRLLTPPFRTSISYQLLSCFAQLQNHRIHEFTSIDLVISGSYLGPHWLQYLFLIPTGIEKQFLLSDMPAT